MRKASEQRLEPASTLAELPSVNVPPEQAIGAQIVGITPQLAGDEAALSFELREPRLGENDATLQVFKLFFQIDGHRRTIRRFTTANQQAARHAMGEFAAAPKAR